MRVRIRPTVTSLKVEAVSERINGSPPIRALKIVRDGELETAPVIPLLGNKRTVKAKLRLLEALVDTLGVISYACEKTQVNRDTYYVWCKTDGEFNRRAQAVLQVQIDFVEQKLLQRIEKNDTIAMLFYLKCKAKNRGYIEQSRMEHTGANGGAILTMNGNLNIDVAKEEITPNALRCILENILSGKAAKFQGKFAPPVADIPLPAPEEE